MVKKIIFGIVNIVSVLIIVAAVFVLCIVVMTSPGEPPQIMGYTALRIVTGSMAPTYDVDTLVIVKDTKASEIKKDDVISFYSADPLLDGAVNTHRVVEVREENGQRVFVTKGDSNNVVDAYNVEEKYLIGKVVYASVILGKLSRIISNPIVFLPVILIPLAVILISNLVSTMMLAKKIAREEEEAAVREAIREIKEKRDQ